MSIKKYILKIKKSPNKVMGSLFRKFPLSRLINDKLFLKISYFLYFGKRLNLNNPQTFNEKLQWLKLYDRKDKYVNMVDKYEAKKYVANIIGEEYIIPTIGIYNSFDEIDFNKLPNQFVIKCTHDSGGLFIVKDKSKENIGYIRKKICKCLNNQFYYIGREWPYKKIKPRIIIEKYMSNETENELIDYKIFNFNGRPKIILTCSERSKELKETWFNEKFEKLDLTEGGHDVDVNIKKPKELNEMLEISKKLSRNIPFVRTDFYIINKKIYFGEITFYPASGFENFNPKLFDEVFGSWIDLENSK